MSRKKTYLKYYKIEPCEKNGKIKSEVVYVGDYYVLDMSPSFIRRIRIELITYLVIINFFLFATLFIDSSSSYISYVVLPQAAALAMGLIGGTLIFPFLRGKTRYDIKQRNDALIAPKSYYVAKCILLSLNVIVRMIFLIVKVGEYSIPIEISFLVGGIISFALSLREYFLIKGIKFIVESGPAPIDVQSVN